MIGLIDSGKGGLFMLKSLEEKYLTSFYLLMDKTSFPYGNKSLLFLYKRLNYLIDYLINKKCDRIIIACNTLCTTVLKYIKKDIKLIDISKLVIDYVKNLNVKSISLIATTNTINSNFYQRNLNIKVNIINGDKYIKLIEDDIFIDFSKLEIKDEYLILGCTHFIKYKNNFNAKTISQDDLIKLNNISTIEEI